MNTEELLQEITDLFEEATVFPLSGGKVLVDPRNAKAIIEEIICSLPDEIKQARAIVADRNAIILKAKNEAEAISLRAEEQAKRLVARDEIVKTAQATSNEMLSQAQAKAKDMRLAAGEYVDSLMNEADLAISTGIAKLKESRTQLIANLNEDFDLSLGELSDGLTVVRKARQNVKKPKTQNPIMK